MGNVIGIIIVGAIACAAVSGPAQAQAFPTRPVTLIVPWPAGGTTDVAMRALATATENHLGQPIVIENRPGAGGTIAPMQMAARNPDGYVVAQIPMSLLRVALLRQMAFDPAKDLSFIIGLTGYTFGVVIKSESPWKTFQELLADAKAKPGKLTYGSAGTGTTPHLTMARIAKQFDINWTHVPFKGSAEAINAVLGGHIDMIADGTAWGPMVNDGRLRLLVTWGRQRTANWPTVPTLRESGVDLVSYAPYGIAGPKGMDPMIIKRLHDAFKRGMEEPSYREVLDQLGQESLYMDSKEYSDFAMREIAEQSRMITELGFKLDQKSSSK